MSVIIFITNKAENTAQDVATLLERQTLTHWSHALRSELIFIFKYKEKLLLLPLKEKVALCQRPQHPRTFHSCYLTLMVDDNHVPCDPYFSQGILEVIKFLVLV